MSVSKEVLNEVGELVSKGKTERAIVLLRNALKDASPENRIAIRQVLLLSGQFNNWEDEKLSGIREDSKELNRINRELLVLVENLEHPQRQARAFVPPTSPDPLTPVYHTPQPQHPQPQSAPKSKVVQYITYFFVGLGALALLGLIIGEDDPEPDFGQNEFPEFQPEGNFAPGGETFIPVLPNAQPQEAASLSGNFITSTIRSNIQRIVASGEDIDPSSLRIINPSILQSQLGNTNWYASNLNYVSFDPGGAYATYLNGSASIQLAYWVDKGFYFGQYAETANGDYGYIAIIPPGSEEFMTIYTQSLVSRAEGFIELGRR
jgi:hypothetical protein